MSTLRTSAHTRRPETILLVEDDDSARQMTRDNLFEFGYEVLEAADAREALSIVDTFDSEIDVLITDMVIGRGGTGRDVALEVRRRSPETRVIVMSGQAENAGAAASLFPPETRFLSKPLTLSRLLGTVRAALDGRGERVGE
jgi:two-component system cell cycle sensor histidine kinase/response regulator CckA